MKFYRYRTGIFIGAWNRSRAAALQEAVRDDVASWRSRARDEVQWHVAGEIEESESAGDPEA